MLTLPSSSLFSIHPWKYGIFLSFCGKDTRKSFTDHLYKALNRNGIITFRDDNLEKGKNISSTLLTAIQESWGSIIVFSEGYAFSSWCLDELVEIVKQRKERGHKVYPIFYDIEVSDIRHQSNSVHEAFDKHEKSYKEKQEKIQTWRHALTEVANISGWPLKDEYESKIIEIVVKEITAKLSQTCLHLEKLHSKLNIEKDDVGTIEVCGQDGTGSTIIITSRDEHLLQSFLMADMLTTLDAPKIEHETKVVQRLHMNDLKAKLKDLNGVKDDIELRKSVKLNSRKKLKTEVRVWSENVERINEEIYSLEETGIAAFWGFHAENVSMEYLQEVKELLQRAGRFHGSLVIDEPRWIGQTLAATTLVGEAPKAYMEKIWEHLMDNEVGKIGVCGMEGVGKTAIIKLINNQLLNEFDKFGIVICVTVSKEMTILTIFKVQEAIASGMRQTLSNYEEKTIRAGKLHEMLSGKGRYVLILDDVWDKISLEEAGIPEPSNGSKLVITTRLKDLCYSLDCQVVVQIPTHQKKDALSLFLQKVGPDIMNDPNISLIVESVVEQCAGLALAIVTVASNMKGVRNIHEWRNALNVLNGHVKSVNKSNVLQQIQFSYNHLEEEERVKQCFPCYKLYPEDYSEIYADLLKKLWIAEGLVEELDNMQEEIEKGHSILNKLINDCLLEDVVKYGCSYVKVLLKLVEQQLINEQLKSSLLMSTQRSTNS